MTPKSYRKKIIALIRSFGPKFETDAANSFEAHWGAENKFDAHALRVHAHFRYRSEHGTLFPDWIHIGLPTNREDLIQMAGHWKWNLHFYGKDTDACRVNSLAALEQRLNKLKDIAPEIFK